MYIDQVRGIYLRKTLIFVPFNILMMLIWFYGSRLMYWCLEGYIPAALLIGGPVLVLTVWVLGNIWLIRKTRVSWTMAALIIAATLLLMNLDPWLKPIYLNVMNRHAMFQSFEILKFFRSWK
ncbi:hypothetical protein [Paenibacillus turpanensis]|uniref:hypothetical protein n=1 Tax=Paenibacillus turpanensis TaxID=2689078 RepID=UPI00140E3C12|nr:hypothetical protein [Paenibacillus turpanensis]